MTHSIRLGIVAITSIFLIASMVAYLAPPGQTGLFAESNGDCTTVNGGVRSYRYCGDDVEVVHQEIGFKQSRWHEPFIASSEQVNRNFDAPGDANYHRLISHPPLHPKAAALSQESLNEEPFSQARYASRNTLFDDPYESTPWKK